MSIAEKYYTNTARVRAYIEMNDRGDTGYEDEITIPCRFDYEQKEVLDSKGDKVLSSATMFCGAFIPSLSIVYDECNSRFTVKSCKPIQDIHGGIDHYEVVL